MHGGTPGLAACQSQSTSVIVNPSPDHPVAERSHAGWHFQSFPCQVRVPSLSSVQDCRMFLRLRMRETQSEGGTCSRNRLSHLGTSGEDLLGRTIQLTSKVLAHAGIRCLAVRSCQTGLVQSATGRSESKTNCSQNNLSQHLISTCHAGTRPSTAGKANIGPLPWFHCIF